MKSINALAATIGVIFAFVGGVAGGTALGVWGITNPRTVTVDKSYSIGDPRSSAVHQCERVADQEDKANSTSATEDQPNLVNVDAGLASCLATARGLP